MAALIGREAELRRIDAAVVRGRSVLIQGASGMGASRLADEVRRGCRDRGMSTRLIIGSGAVPAGGAAPSEGEPDTAAPTLAVVDDAHLLPGEVIASLVADVAAGTLVVVATAPADASLAASVVALGREPLGEQVLVGPLAAPAAAELIDALLEEPVELATRRRLVRAAAGSPRLLLGLVRAGQASGRLQLDDGLWAWHGPLCLDPTLLVDEGLALHAVDGEARAMLEAVGCLGTLPMAAIPALDPAGRAADLERAGLLAVDGHGRVVPASPLVAELLEDQVGTLARVEVVRRCLGPVRVVPPVDASERLTRAVLGVEVGDPPGRDELVWAAHEALDRSEHVAAEALALAAGVEGDIALSVVLARSLHGQERFDEADRAFRAIELADAEDELVTAHALAHARTLRIGLDRAEEADQVLAEAQARMGDERARWTLAAGHASASLLAGRLTGLVERWDASDGMSSAARAGLAEPAAAALGMGGRFTRCAEVAAWAAAEGGDERVALLASLWRFVPMAAAGAIEEVEPVAAPMYQQLVDGGQDLWRRYLALPMAWIAWHRGDLDGAGRLAREAMALPATGQVLVLQAQALLGLVLVATGQRAEARQLAAAVAAETDPIYGLHLPLLDGVAALAGHARTSASAATQVVSAGQRAWANGDAVSAALLLHEAAVAGAGEPASAALDGLRGVVESPWADLVATHAAAVSAGDAVALDAVAVAAERAGLLLLGTRSSRAAAEVWEASGRAVLAIRSWGMHDDLVERCPGLVAPPRHDLGLTGREREVASLAAAAMTDKEIAAELSVSVRTVHAHLRSVYAKLGVAGRRDLRPLVSLFVDPGG